MSRREHGFSLIEMAFVLIIVTLLLGGLLVPFATQVEQKRIAETQKAMEEIKEALIGYAMVTANSATDGRPRFPCPDANNDGIAEPWDTVNLVCPPGTGLPWATLGVASVDAWGNRFRYRVTPDYARSDTGFTFNTGGTLNVCLAAGCGAGTSIAQSIPVVILSHGKNGYGAINSNRVAGDTTAIPCPVGIGCSKDEQENFNGDTLFVSRTMTTSTVAAGEFDDQVIWLSPNVLFNRMVAAGRLP